MNNLGLNKLIFITTAVGSLVAGAAGVLSPDIYRAVVSDRLLPGAYAQDLFVVGAALVMIALTLRLKSGDHRKAAVLFGLLGFFFYAFAIYAIEQVYTLFYPLYLAVLAVSFYGLVHGLASMRLAGLEALTIHSAVRIGAAGYGLFIAVLFNCIWLSQLIPLLRAGDRIEYTFSVYIIDLVFIMPAFAITAVLAIRKRGLGLIGLPALFIVGAVILAPLALGELLKPIRYGEPMDSSAFWLYGTLSLIFLVVATGYLLALRRESR